MEILFFMPFLNVPRFQKIPKIWRLGGLFFFLVVEIGNLEWKKQPPFPLRIDVDDTGHA